MDGQKPKVFFANRNLSEAAILIAFLDTFEPFAKMVETIFRVCSRSERGATGGNDFTIAYDEAAQSLRFDVQAFKRFRHLYQMVTRTSVTPRYHSDYVPGFGYYLQKIANRDFQVRSNVREQRHASIDQFAELLALARDVGNAHLSVIDELINRPDDDIHEWLTNRGVTGDWLPRDREGVLRWSENISAGLSALDTITWPDIISGTPSEAWSEIYFHLDRVLSAISIKHDDITWARAVQEWLELPFWKKRWQVFEVWVLALWLHGLLASGGRLVSDKGVVVLRTGTRSHPIAVLELTSIISLELWLEFRLPESDDLRPDIVLIIKHGMARLPVQFIECNQWANTTTEGMLQAAEKYLNYMPIAADNFVVNYDPFSAGVANKLLCAGRNLTALGDVRPGEKGFQVLADVIDKTFGRKRLWVVVVDTTGSMHSKLEYVANHLSGARTLSRSNWLLVLYGDHQDIYTVKQGIETSNISLLQKAVLDAPRTSGGDEPEALEDALSFARQQIQERGANNAGVVVFTDAPAHKKEECANSCDFHKELEVLVSLNSEVILVACGTTPNSLGWIDLPSGVTTTTLESHKWPTNADGLVSYLRDMRITDYRES